MCFTCLRDELDGQSVVFTAEMAKTARLIRAWYELPGCGVGGPLHITTDDHNINDRSLASCSRFLDEEPVEFGQDIGREILRRLSDMTEVERAATVWAWGARQDYNLDRIINNAEDHGDVATIRASGEDEPGVIGVRVVWRLTNGDTHEESWY